MLEVTEGAKQALKELKSAKVGDPEAGLRLTVSSPGEFGLSIDTEREGDEVVEHEGSKILFIEGNVSSSLEGFTIDVQDTPEGTKLTISKKA
jgi:Fe-S cluster assembly iron-binding protein IscA